MSELALKSSASVTSQELPTAGMRCRITQVADAGSLSRLPIGIDNKIQGMVPSVRAVRIFLFYVYQQKG